MAGTVAFDAAFYPHLMDLIVEAASPELLLALRQTCRRLRARVLAVLQRHMVFDRQGGRTLYGGLWSASWASGISTDVLDLGEGNDWAASSAALQQFATGARVDVLRTFSDVSAGIKSRRVYYFASPQWGAYITPHLVPSGADLEMLVVNCSYDSALPSIDHMRTQQGYEYLQRGLERLGAARRVVLLFSPRGDPNLRQAHFKEVDDLAQTILRSGLSREFELVGTEGWTFDALEKASDESVERNLQHRVWIDLVEAERAKMPAVPAFTIMLRAVLRFYAVSDQSRHLASVAMAGPLPTTTVNDRYADYLSRVVFTTEAEFRRREGERHFALMTRKYPELEAPAPAPRAASLRTTSDASNAGNTDGSAEAAAEMAESSGSGGSGWSRAGSSAGTEGTATSVEPPPPAHVDGRVAAVVNGETAVGPGLAEAQTRSARDVAPIPLATATTKRATWT